MASVLPEECFPAVAYALERYFASPHFSDASGNIVGAFASSDSAGRAEMLASFLCGSSQSVPMGLPAEGQGLSAQESRPGRRRVLFTGCFDLMHAGHYNALRQAKACFPGEEVTLVAGIHSDEAIQGAKGSATVLNHSERVELAKACRWVDEVAENLPYEVPVSLLDRLDCEVAVHGDDLPQATNGSTGLFDEVLKAGRLKIVRRTEGTSTTVLIGRLLTLSKDHLLRKTKEEQVLARQKPVSELQLASVASGRVRSSSRSRSLSPKVRENLMTNTPPLWMMLPTMSRLSLFYGDGRVRLGEAKRVIYVPGEWDLFHIGHVRFLEQAKALGDFVLVGVYDDETVHKKKGRNFPLQTLHERALNILACKFADDVVLAAPWQTTKDLITSLNVSVVVTGTINQYATATHSSSKSEGSRLDTLGDPFEYPRASGMLQLVESTCHLTMDVIADRICERFESYTARQTKKESAEIEYSEGKVFVAEK